MSEATQSLEHAEHIEHAAHQGHHGGGHHDDHDDKKGQKPPSRLPKAIGLTIAVLGVLLAVCAALVGSERTDLISMTVQQASANNEYQAEATRYRTTLAQVEALDAINPGDTPEGAKEIASIGAGAGPGQADTVSAIRQAVHIQMNAAAPDTDVVERLVKLARTHQAASAAAKAWADAHTEVIKGHYEAAERFERCQLLTEIGIVIASVALLLANRLAWVVALLLGAGSLTLAVMTYLATHAEVKEATAHLQEAQHKFEESSQSKEVASEDEEVLKSFEESFAADKAEDKAAPPAPSSAAPPAASSAAPPGAAPAEPDEH